MRKKNYIILLLLLLISLTCQERKLPKKEIEKIKKGLFLDSYMLSKNELFYNKNNSLNEEEEQRKLEDNSITLTEVGFFSFHLRNVGRTVYSYQHLFGNIDKDKSKYILYPYAFKYKNQEDEEIEQNEGGFFSLNPNILPTSSTKHFFETIKDITSVKIEKSKALYDIDIGILTLETTYEGMPINLFSEADLFCNYFVQRIGKVSICVKDSKELSDFRSSEDTQGKGAVMLISPDELLNKDILFRSGLNNFELLIIPDHVYDTQDIIKKELTQKGIDKMKEFVQNGGNALATRKSGYL